MAMISLQEIATGCLSTTATEHRDRRLYQPSEVYRPLHLVLNFCTHIKLN